MGYVRSVAAATEPASLGATLIKNSLIELCLATECRIIADMTFTSRDAAERTKETMSEAFDAMQEIAADDMDSITYRALIGLQAAMTVFLLTAQRPLPRMLNFQFAAPGPTLVFAHKLYQDAGRADQLREENRVVHPLFMGPFGRALAS
jgi:prophage DNA circulation protein